MRRPTEPSPSADSTDAGDWIGRTAGRALAYALSLTGDRQVAEDLVQDCYQRLLAKAATYQLEIDGPRLLFRAITNACINWTQRRRPTVSLESFANGEDELRNSAAVASVGDDPLQQAIAGELALAVNRSLAELPVEQRAAVELHAMGHGAAEIAEALGTSAGNARVLLHRGRQRLAERLKPFLES